MDGLRFLGGAGRARCFEPGWLGRWQVAMYCLETISAWLRMGRTFVSVCRWLMLLFIRHPVAILSA